MTPLGNCVLELQVIVAPGSNRDRFPAPDRRECGSNTRAVVHHPLLFLAANLEMVCAVMAASNDGSVTQPPNEHG